MSRPSPNESPTEAAVVLPLSPIPPVAFVGLALRCGKVVFDGGEHYVKQTVRNRYHILSANGVQALTIPVRHTGRLKTPTAEVKIDHRKPWTTNHLRAIQAAYRSAPFYDHYIPAVENLLRGSHGTLGDFFEAGWTLWYELLNMEPVPAMERTYVENFEGWDARKRYKSPHDLPAEWATPPYPQVFEDRFDFVPNLSVLDLLLNEGPAAKDFMTARKP